MHSLNEQAQNIPLDERSIYLRQLALRTLIGGNYGHIGSTLSLIEIMRVLYDEILHFRAENPSWEGRDRCILSKGHGCIAQYVLLADKKFFPVTALDTFCQHDSILGGYPDPNKIPGVEAGTGTLGHGLAIGLGIALAAKIKKQSHHVYIIMGDGEINEGSVWETGKYISKYKLSNLTAIIDSNKIQSAGFTADVQNAEPLADKWKSFNFNIKEVNGHDINELRRVLDKSSKLNKPTLIICHTIKGKGISLTENNPHWHHESNFNSETLHELNIALRGQYA